MRASYIVLLAAAVLLVKCDFVCANAEQTKLSKVVSTDAVGISVHAIGAVNEKRRLRFHYAEDEDDEEKDDESDKEEERAGGANLFSKSKLNQMMSGVKEFKRYKNLKAYGYSPGDFKTKLESMYGKTYKDLWERYSANFYSL